MTNLSVAFPEWDEEQKQSFLIKVYRHLILLIFEMIRLFSWNDTKVLEMVNTEEIESHLTRFDKGGILVSAHIGNWEVFARALSIKQFPLSVIMKRQKNELINNMIEQWRNRVGMEIIYTKGALKKSLYKLKEGRIVTLLGDQDARSKGIFSDFFGRKSATHVGAAILAWQTDKPVIFGAGIRHQYGQYEAISESVDVTLLKKQAGNDKDRFIQLFVDDYNRFLERIIRQYPDQYFWFHKKWKTNHPDDEKVNYG